MSLLQLSLDDIPINLLLFRFTKNSFSCIDANNLALEELGTTKEGLTGMMLGDIFPSAKEVGFEDALLKLHHESTSLEVDITIQSLYSQYYWHCTKVQKLGNGDILTFFSDILQYKNIKNELDTMQQIAHIGHWKWDILKDVITWSDEVYRIFGEEPQSFKPTFEHFLSYLKKEDQTTLQELVNQAMQTKEPYSIEHQVNRQNGTIAYVQGSGSVEFSKKGEPIFLMGSVFDITKTRESLLKLQYSEEKFRKITETSLMGIFIYKEFYVYANNAFCDMCGYTLNQVLQKHPWELIELSSHESIKTIVERRLKGEEFPKEYTDLIYVHPDGSQRVMRVISQTIFYEGAYAGLGTVMDITDIQETKKKLELLAKTDNLTGISNRYYMNQVLDAKIVEFNRYKEDFILLMIDIDFFKRINDNFGHDIGDYILKEVTEIISLHIREGDELARWGGEEFLLLLPRTSQDEAKTVADKLRTLIDKHSFKNTSNITISIGMTAFTETDTKESLLKRVDTTLYIAKDNGRNCVVFNNSLQL
ncbi:diguanylate cyclase/phosphodiesterase (GGDEF & EAL domains) with PAS/PAC sensor(s) [hydrothermal vent metagenome]|uniref:Diguanylate cyclase/phosphodiesterase (GGDEF & EAL domains) with PAS/PAC sensor(S) n=1 Tax=hydrothermal vent metagenome TaxID=652676 RepID=A0A1W1CEI4_9ZZZZ